MLLNPINQPTNKHIIIIIIIIIIVSSSSSSYIVLLFGLENGEFSGGFAGIYFRSYVNNQKLYPNVGIKEMPTSFGRFFFFLATF